MLASRNGAEAQERFYMDSLYAKGGIEMRLDERVFSFLCLMNIAGYDEALVRRQEPIPAYVFHPMRMRVRLTFGPLRRIWDPQFSAFFDGHQKPFSEYLRRVLTLSPPPEFRPSQKDSELKGFEEMLATFHKAAGLSEFFSILRPEVKNELKGMLPLIDAKIQKIIDYLKLGEEEEGTGKPIVFVYSDLLHQDAVFEYDLEDGYYYVTGPAVSGSPADGVEMPYLKAVMRQFGPALGDQAKKELDRIHLYAKKNAEFAALYPDAVPFAVQSLARAAAEKLFGPAEQMCVAALEGQDGKALGDLLVKPVEAALEAYEKSGKPMKEYVSELFAGLKADRIIANFEAQQAKQTKK